uniref:Uncharacterized protein n=1 Tax=Oryza brachyantha TaxID=4533 RepID=J3N6Z3_ORYBR
MNRHRHQSDLCSTCIKAAQSSSSDLGDVQNAEPVFFQQTIATMHDDTCCNNSWSVGRETPWVGSV